MSHVHKHVHRNKVKIHSKRNQKPNFKSTEKQWKVQDQESSSLKTKYMKIDASSVKNFTDLPLSKRTLEGLKELKFDCPTEIQRESIGLALQGNDVLGAAKTGSGKTLAFIIPVLECLLQQKWTQMDGMGALIISPTRELAYQTFEVLRKIGKKHDFSAGLVIGGKHMKEEAERINRTNIVVCTPGRLLQHMDETVNFTASSLHILVLDEADRILDLGFAQTMNAIIENLPLTRQTLLFSATQTKSVKDLARLSLKNPMYVSVHEHSEYRTPSQLLQSYVVCQLQDKLNFLWSFVKHHLKHKILVFISSCKQVRYIYEQFRHLRPGNAVLALHGGMHQLKRVDVYRQFVHKQHAVLFATDLAARGLDFPEVHWVIQLDCPEDTDTYIHRAGRTARYERDGESLLILLPSETVMVDDLKNQKIPIEQIKANPKRLWSMQGKLEGLCAANVEVKEMAQRAFVAYLKSVFLMRDKKVFDIHQLDLDSFARSLGLALSPRVRFLEKDKKRKEEQVARALQSNVTKKKTAAKDSQENQYKNSQSETLSSSSSENESEMSSDGEEDAVSEHKADNTFSFDTDSDEDVLTVKKTQSHDWIDQQDSPNEFSLMNFDDIKSKRKIHKVLTKYALAKKLKKKNLKINTKVVFDEQGEEIGNEMSKQKTTQFNDDGHYEGGIDLDQRKKVMQLEDQIDKKIFRERIRKKHREEKIKRKELLRVNKKLQEEDDEEVVAYLGVGGDGGSEGLEPHSDVNDEDQECSEMSDNEQPVVKRQKKNDDISNITTPNDNGSQCDHNESDSDSNQSCNDDSEGSFDSSSESNTFSQQEALALKLLQ